MITPTKRPQTVQRIAKDQSPDELDKLALGYAIYHWITGAILLKTGLFVSMYINYVLNLWCMIWVIIHFHLKHFFNIIIYFSKKFPSLSFKNRNISKWPQPFKLQCALHLTTAFGTHIYWGFYLAVEWVDYSLQFFKSMSVSSSHPLINLTAAAHWEG